MNRIIIHVTTRLNIGGVTKQVLTTVQELKHRGRDILILAGHGTSHEGDLGETAEAQGIAFIRLKWLSNQATLCGDIKAIVELYRLFRRLRPAVVHLHMFKARVLGSIAARLGRVPVIVETLHGNVLRGYFGRVLTRIILATERFVGRRLVNAIIAPSEQQAVEIREHRIAQPFKIRIYRHGFDLLEFRDLRPLYGQLRAELGIHHSAVMVGVVSRLVPIKGLHNYLEAASNVLQAYGRSSVSFVVIGDGELRNELESYSVQLGLEGTCHFLGWRGDIRRVYADLDIVVLSSLNEGTPVTLIEAMAAGKAIVSTAVGGVPDMLEDGVSAYLVPPQDPKALATAIIKLVDDPVARDNIGKAAQERAFQDYGISHLIEKLEELYDNLLSKRGIGMRTFIGNRDNDSAPSNGCQLNSKIM